MTKKKLPPTAFIGIIESVFNRILRYIILLVNIHEPLCGCKVFQSIILFNFQSSVGNSMQTKELKENKAKASVILHKLFPFLITLIFERWRNKYLSISSYIISCITSLLCRTQYKESSERNEIKLYCRYADWIKLINIKCILHINARKSFKRMPLLCDARRRFPL